MYEKELNKLANWFEYHNNNGFYLGSSHHPIWGIVNINKYPHTFHYYGIIVSYLNLYKNLSDETYLNKAIEAGNALCKLQKSSGQYKFDTFEYNDGAHNGLTLIHDALPSTGLLYLYESTKNKKYLKTAKKNILWFTSRLWNSKYLTGCINQDMCAAEALIKLYSIGKNKRHLKIGKNIADWCLNYQIKDLKLKGGFLRGKNEENLVIPWYDAKTAVCYYNIYKITGDKKYLESAKETADFIRRNLKNDSALISHYRKETEWIKKETPYLISPAAICYSLFDKLNIKYKFNLLKFQQKDGSFPNAIGWNDIRDNAVMGWNQFVFIYLSSKTKKAIDIKKPDSIIENNKLPEQKNNYKFNINIKPKGKIGYIDFIKDNFIYSTYKYTSGNIPTFREHEKINLRFRFKNYRWKTYSISSRDNFISLRLMPYFIIKPYVLLENIYTKIMILFFGTKIFDVMGKMRFWKK